MPDRRLVASPDDPRLDPFRTVADPERVRRSGLFVAEGRRVVGELLRTGGYEIRGLLLTRSAAAALGGLLDRARADVLFVEGPAALRDVAGYRFHQGCLALVERPADRAVTGLVEGAGRGEALLVVLDRVTDPDNVGAVFRSALAFGARGVLLGPGCAHPLYRKALRTSLGAALRLPFAMAGAWPGDLDHLRRSGFTLVALTPDPQAAALGDALRPVRGARVALLLGSEERGLDEAVVRHASVRARIDHDSVVDSLNIAAAAAVALYAFRSRGSEVPTRRGHPESPA